jgi:hypothetical protein
VIGSGPQHFQYEEIQRALQQIAFPHRHRSDSSRRGFT